MPDPTTASFEPPDLRPPDVPDGIEAADLTDEQRVQAARALLYSLERQLVAAQATWQTLAELAGLAPDEVERLERRAVRDEFAAMEGDEKAA